MRRERAVASYGGADFIRRFTLEGLVDRLESISREFSAVLDLGCFDGAFPAPPGARIVRLDPAFGFASKVSRGVQADEDRLPFADGSFDLIVAAGTFDSVEDIPGALALARRALKPDGLFLAGFVGASSLPMMREALRVAEATRPVARIHPQIDVRAAGDLLMRAGFALPVADVETLTVRYASLFSLMHDLRAMGASNIMPGRRIIRRDSLARAATAFAGRSESDGRTAERFDIIFMTGWAPAPSQPQPARRGSATQSLATALKPKR